MADQKPTGGQEATRTGTPKGVPDAQGPATPDTSTQEKTIQQPPRK